MPLTFSPQPATLAFLFPGQGSQSLGMLAELASEYAVVRATFDEASEGAKGVDLWDAVAAHGPEEALNRTDNTQPALLAAGVAVWRVWQELSGATPQVLAGHSLGEYTALVCAQAISLTDAAALVAERGRLMQAAVPRGVGAMAAILGGDDAQIAPGLRRSCRRAGGGPGEFQLARATGSLPGTSARRSIARLRGLPSWVCARRSSWRLVFRRIAG